MEDDKTVKVSIERMEVNVYTFPTESPESDGTLEWSSTTVVVVHVFAGGVYGLGYSYTVGGAAQIIRDHLVRHVVGQNAMSISSCWTAMIQTIRNIGDTGVAMMAVSAVDGALWDLKAKLLNLPLVSLLGQVRVSVPAYGSGGFTSYTIDQLQKQLGEWASMGFKMVKMKIGRDSKSDLERVKAARDTIGPDVELFVDANGGYNRKQALIMAEAFNQYRVKWFEEPVIHHDLEGLRLLRDRVPSGMDISIGEYGFDLQYFRRCLDAQALDVLQADATRCGITGFLQADVLSRSHFVPLPARRTAPPVKAHTRTTMMLEK